MPREKFPQYISLVASRPLLAEPSLWLHRALQLQIDLVCVLALLHSLLTEGSLQITQYLCSSFSSPVKWSQWYLPLSLTTSFLYQVYHKGLYKYCMHSFISNPKQKKVKQEEELASQITWGKQGFLLTLSLAQVLIDHFIWKMKYSQID